RRAPRAGMGAYLPQLRAATWEVALARRAANRADHDPTVPGRGAGAYAKRVVAEGWQAGSEKLHARRDAKRQAVQDADDVEGTTVDVVDPPAVETAKTPPDAPAGGDPVDPAEPSAPQTPNPGTDTDPPAGDAPVSTPTASPV